MEHKSHTASLLTSLMLLFIGCIQAGEEMVNVTIEGKHQAARLGGRVRLTVRLEPVPTRGTVIWRHRGPVPVKIAEISLQTNASRVHPDTPYTGRSHISADASLEIGNVTWEDRGEYAVTLSVGPWEPTDSVHLRVFEPIGRTAIAIANVSSTNQSCVATFSCSTEGGSAVSYSWRAGAQQEPVLGRQKELRLSLNGSSGRSTLVCIAWNPVSTQNGTFDLTKACVAEYPGIVPLSSGQFPISVFSCVGIFFLLLAAGIVYWTHRSRSGNWMNRVAESVSSPSKSVAGRFTESKGPSPQVATQRADPAIPPDPPSPLEDVTTEYCEIQVPAPGSSRAVETEV